MGCLEITSITIDGLSKRYGMVQALDHVSLSVKDGEFVVLLGPSGSGKTTLLRCIAGLETQDEGSISIGEEVVDELGPRERDVSMVFQNYALFPLMTVRENIAFPLRVRHVASAEIEERVKEVARKLEIGGLLHKHPRQLSGGEQQRVAIGRAIVRQTKALLMDEPLSNLDAPLRAQLRTELKAIQTDLGVTVVYVTHDQLEAMTLAERIGVIDRGRLLQFDTPGELYSSPASAFVAGFVGSPGSNLIDVTVSEGGAAVSLTGSGYNIRVPDSMVPMLREPGKRLILSVRPEDISLLKSQETFCFPVTVRLLEPLGAYTLVDLGMADATMKAMVSRDFEARVGDKLWARVNFERARIFDRDESSSRKWSSLPEQGRSS